MKCCKNLKQINRFLLKEIEKKNNCIDKHKREIKSIKEKNNKKNNKIEKINYELLICGIL